MKIKTLIALLFLSQPVHANLIINEVLSNEPGSSTSLEWIELYNDSDTALSLSNYTFKVLKMDTLKYTLLLPSITIDAHAYQIICKKLYSAPNETSFENYWGNGTNVWGDSGFELSTPEPIELSFNLSNGDGTIQLLEGQIEISSFSWDETGTDGVSWERKFSDSTIILPSVSKNNSTPGILNSITLLQHDLSIDSVSIIVENTFPTYIFQISNRGLTAIDDGMLIVNQVPFELPLLHSDSSTIFEVSFELESSLLYNQLTAVVYILNDDRMSNDTLEFTSVSNQYPPLLISEFLANPHGEISVEWIEIYNRSLTEIDLRNWSVGDELKEYPITIDSFYLLPNQYLLLSKSVDTFLKEYPLFSGSIIELSSWAILNNENDAVRLADNYDITADIYSYSKLYDDNYTVAREFFDETYRWGRSSEPNGTPGYENDIFQISEFMHINLSSKYISPDGDGYEDIITIEIDIPESEKYTLKLYDINGNIVKMFHDEKNYISNTIIWDGLSDKKTKLPIGIYILYLSTDEGLSAKETIVIAR